MATAVLQKAGSSSALDAQDGVRTFFLSKIDELSSKLRDKQKDLRRLQAQRNELNSRVYVYNQYFLQVLH